MPNSRKPNFVTSQNRSIWAAYLRIIQTGLFNTGFHSKTTNHRFLQISRTPAPISVLRNQTLLYSFFNRRSILKTSAFHSSFKFRETQKPPVRRLQILINVDVSWSNGRVVEYSERNLKGSRCWSGDTTTARVSIAVVGRKPKSPAEKRGS